MVKIEEGHKQIGRWIIVPVSDLQTPKPGRIVYGPMWWAVTENDEVLFFDSYGSPQCNHHKSTTERIAKGYGAPPTTAQFLDVAFLPHNCSDY